MIISAKNTEKHEVFYKWKLIETDKDDNKFVDCAVAGNADYLITNDKYFNSVKSIDFPPITILNSFEFIKILQHRFSHHVKFP